MDTTIVNMRGKHILKLPTNRIPLSGVGGEGSKEGREGETNELPPNAWYVEKRRRDNGDQV
jgi:hypothetical protein